MKHNSLKLFVTTAAMAAIVFVLGLTPLGIIPLGFMNVTILHIPVVIGTLTLGLKPGLVLGMCFGLASTLRAFGIPTPASALVSNLMASQPLYVIIMSILPRICVPVTTYFMYKLVSCVPLGNGEKKTVSAVADSLIFIIAFPVLLIALYALNVIKFWMVLVLFALFALFELVYASKTDNSSLIISSVTGSLTNTVLYLGLMLLFYYLTGNDTDVVLKLIP